MALKSSGGWKWEVSGVAPVWTDWPESGAGSGECAGFKWDVTATGSWISRNCSHTTQCLCQGQGEWERGDVEGKGSESLGYVLKMTRIKLIILLIKKAEGLIHVIFR